MFRNMSEGRRFLLALLAGTGAALLLGFLGVLAEYSRSGRKLDFSFTMGIWSAQAGILMRTIWGMIGVVIGSCVGFRSVRPGAFLIGFGAGAIPFAIVFLLQMISSASNAQSALEFLVFFLLTSLPSGIAALIVAGDPPRDRIR